MGKPLRIAQHSWVGGMLNEDLMGRQDLAKYFQGATEITNFVVRRQGCLMKRGGTDIVAALDGVDANSRIIPFLYDRNNGFCLLFSNEKIRVFPGYTYTSWTRYRVTRKIRFREKWWVNYYAANDANYGLKVFGTTTNWTTAFPVSTATAHKNGMTYTDGGTTPLSTEWSNPAADFSALLDAPDAATPLGAHVAVESNGVSRPASSTAYSALKSRAGGDIPANVGEWLTGAGQVRVSSFFNGRSCATASGSAIYFGYAERIVEIEFACTRDEGTVADWASVPGTDAIDFVKAALGSNTATGGENGLFFRAANASYDFGGNTVKSKCGFVALADLAVFEKSEASGIGESETGVCAAPYTAGHLHELRYCQSGDTLFLVHPLHPVYKLVRQFDGTFDLEELSMNKKLPAAPGMPVTLSYNEVRSSGSARILSYAATQVIDGVESRPAKRSREIPTFPWGSGGYIYFTVTPDKAATEIRIYRDEGFGYGLIRILDAKNGAGVSVKDIYIACDYAKEPPRDPDPVFNTAGGYPSCVSLYQQRMIFANTLLNPNRYWMSNVGDLYTFSTKRTIAEDDAIIASLPLLKGPKILHLVTGKDLLAFTESCEVLIKPSSGNSLSYKTVSTEIQSYTGSNERLPPIVCEAAVLFADRAGQSVREFKYNYAMDTMQGLDVSVLNSALFTDKQIVDWCYQQFPDSNLLCVLSDGTIAVMTYMPDQEVYAWSRFEISGFHVYGCCCSEALIKHADDDSAVLPSTSETFLFGYDSVTERWLLLRMRPYARGNARCLDLVENGTGRPIMSRLVTVYPDVQDGGVVERDKRVTAVTLRLKGGEGLTVRQAGVPDDGLDHTAPSAVNGLTTMTPQSDWSNCDGRVVIEHSGMDGCMIMSLTTALEVH